MLATLRRAGEPFVLSPTQLFSTLMITSGTMTHRLKALEKRGLFAVCQTRTMRAACWSR
jgi:DNA-binding MarR family transcriptional regulator